MTVRSFRMRPIQYSISVTMLISALLLSVSNAPAQTLTTLHSFSNGRDGSHPLAGLTMDQAGNLYGTSSSAGLPNLCAPFGCGTVFKMSYRNSNWDHGGNYNYGEVFEITQ